MSLWKITILAKLPLRHVGEKLINISKSGSLVDKKSQPPSSFMCPIVVSRRRWIIKEVYSCSLQWREARIAGKGKIHHIVENIHSYIVIVIVNVHYIKGGYIPQTAECA